MPYVTDSIVEKFNEPRTIKEPLNSEHSTQWKDAMNLCVCSLLEQHFRQLPWYLLDKRRTQQINAFTDHGWESQLVYPTVYVYVDDILCISNDIKFKKSQKGLLCQRFEIIDQGEVHYI